MIKGIILACLVVMPTVYAMDPQIQQMAEAGEREERTVTVRMIKEGKSSSDICLGCIGCCCCLSVFCLIVHERYVDPVKQKLAYACAQLGLTNEQRKNHQQ